MIYDESIHCYKGRIVIIGYLDNNQRNISTDEQRDIVNQYARDNAYNIDIFINDPDIKNNI